MRQCEAYTTTEEATKKKKYPTYCDGFKHFNYTKQRLLKTVKIRQIVREWIDFYLHFECVLIRMKTTGKIRICSVELAFQSSLCI